MSTLVKSQKMAGQITAYATLVLSAQYCTYLFLILILKDYSRLICWDCGSAVVTVLIFHNRDPYLLNFFIHFKDAGS